MSTDRYPPGTRVTVVNGLGRPRIPGEIVEDDGRRVTVQTADELIQRGRSKVRPVGQASKKQGAARRQQRVKPVREEPRRSARKRDKDYLAFVRKHPCVSCGTKEGIHAHHEGGERGVSQKAHDYYAVSLCWRCHGHWHAQRCLLGYPDLPTVGAELLLARAQVRILIEYFSTQHEEATHPDTD